MELKGPSVTAGRRRRFPACRSQTEMGQPQWLAAVAHSRVCLRVWLCLWIASSDKMRFWRLGRARWADDLEEEVAAQREVVSRRCGASAELVAAVTTNAGEPEVRCSVSL